MRYTCAHCPNLKFLAPPADDPHQVAHAACGLRTDTPAVPQQTRPIRPGIWVSTFTRISVHCPLSNMHVEKSALPQPMARWERRTFEVRAEDRQREAAWRTLAGVPLRPAP
jgi:hypothetical protein